MSRPSDVSAIPESRRETLASIVDRLLAARHVVLTTHLNADPDGAGSEAAVAAWLEARGVRVTITNPTPFPDFLEFLLHRDDLVAELGEPGTAERIADADLYLVLDTGEPKRIGGLNEHFDPARTWVVDHHPANPDRIGHGGVQDPSAGATGELVYDMITLEGGEWPLESAVAAYVAIVSDTGSFRFANTSPRIHRIAAELLAMGIDCEDVFRKLFAVTPLRRVELLREALGRLEFEPETGLAWMTIPDEIDKRLGVTADDYEGLVDHARSLAGARVAVLLRETDPGKVKISLRSNDDANVNRVAREFGGGGHIKASGANVEMPLEEATERVLAATRAELERTPG